MHQDNFFLFCNRINGLFPKDLVDTYTMEILANLSLAELWLMFPHNLREQEKQNFILDDDTKQQRNLPTIRLIAM